MNPGTSSQDPKLPKLLTNDIANLTHFSVTLGGKILDSGGSKISEVGFLIDTTSMPTIGKNLYKFNAPSKSDGNISIMVNYIPANTTFYFRTFASNSYGTGYGNEMKFTSLSEKVFKGTANLSSQQQVTDFGANHYTTIDGDLNISDSVSDLTPLLGLTVINNSLRVTNTLLMNFKGLDSLEEIGALIPNGFYVERNNNLSNFSGLSKLRISRGPVQFYFNNSLINFYGLDNYIAASAGGLRISDCKNLQNFSGLNEMQFIGDNFDIVNNPSLNDITGLGNLTTITGRLNLLNNIILTNLNGLEQIQSLPDGIEITDNTSLSDLNGLRNINSISSTINNGTITINGNPLIKTCLLLARFLRSTIFIYQIVVV